jgi:hypothetical protein
MSLKRLTKALESYSSSLSYLKGYMGSPEDYSDAGIDNIFGFLYDFNHYPDNKPISDLLKSKLKQKDIDAIFALFEENPLDVSDYIYDNCYAEAVAFLESLPKPFLSDYRDYLENIGAIDPNGGYTKSYFDPDVEVVKPSTWLVHFSDDAETIWRQGFRLGNEDPSYLGLTFFKQKHAPGYNFAFVAASDDAHKAGTNKKYGNSAVMFRCAGVKAFHLGDWENQVIFHGPTVKPSKMVLLNYVPNQKSEQQSSWAVIGSDGRVLVYRDFFDDAAQWVMSHEAQYRKLLYRERAA